MPAKKPASKVDAKTPLTSVATVEVDAIPLVAEILDGPAPTTKARAGAASGSAAGSAAKGAAAKATGTGTTTVKATKVKAAAKPKAKAAVVSKSAKGGSDDGEGDDESDATDKDEDEDDDGEAKEAVTAELVEEEDEEPEPETEGDEREHESEYEEPTHSESSPHSLAKLDAMAVYLREIQRHRLLTPEETRDLAVKFRETEDPAAAAKLVTSNLRLVVKIAYEYRRAYKNIMDLVQEGNIGLMQAVKRYDPYRGVKLSSYAAWWIRAYILRFILNNWRLVKLGTTQAQRKLFFNLRKKRAELQGMGIDPTDAEVAKRLNVAESDVSEMEVRLSGAEKSLDAPVGDADGRSISKIDTMPSMSLSPEALVADEELQALLKDKLQGFRKTIDGRDKDVAIFDERLVADDPLTLQELGERFGISRERVRQLEQRLTMRLRDYLKRELGDSAESN